MGFTPAGEAAAHDLLGVAEVAERCGVYASTVVRYRALGRMPEPYAALAGGPVWLKAQIEAWLDGVDPLGVTDVARILDLAPSTISSTFARGGMPEPYARLKQGPIWTRAQIEAWRPEAFLEPDPWGARPMLPRLHNRSRFRSRRLRPTRGRVSSQPPLEEPPGGASSREKVLLLRRQGLVSGAIADHLGLADSTVARYLSECRKTQKLQRQGLSADEIANRLKLPSTIVSRYLELASPR